MTSYPRNAPADPAAEAQTISLDDRSKHLRRLVVEALEGGGRGHIGPSMSPLEILRVLYDEVMRIRPEDPAWPERDRFILSKGHGCLAQYAVLADKGFFPRAALATFCRDGSILGGHPDAGKVPGVEASTGALGHGLPIGVGLALAAKMKRQDWRVFVVMGDGEINEGSVWEAAMSAGKHRLDNLVAIVDYNKLQSFGPTAEVQDLEPLADKWTAFGFATHEVNGHDLAALRDVLARRSPGKPMAVIAHTVKGKGIAFAENAADWHHKSAMKPEQYAQIREAIDHA